ncbi:hypothetical protein [Spongiactinospora sp. TRM90649]|uniref:hypothetical protein n=1 Tax=Spongiactinospora sp. TRM90649 TaxID=3031114 RepID=UPI0023FA2AC6|nr:hypothetical protein [Spongiactinospora sp. TRM90649]MDF5755588.1 hypothetical protein [Spongiactinospora sp. TRM90649]
MKAVNPLRPPGARRPRLAWSLRVLVTTHLAGVLAQAALAGMFVTGDVGMLAAHRDNAVVTHVLTFSMTVAAVLVWRPARGPAWPAWTGGGLIVAENVQIVLGQERILGLHMPLGMLIFGVSAVLTVWAWRWTGAAR